MDCPSCGTQTSVLETRKASGGVRRRRACPDCGERFTTREQLVAETPVVIKRSGRRQRFDRTKLRAGLIRATHKRDVSDHAVEALVDRIEAEAMHDGEIDSDRLGELCLDGLQDLDQGAFLQYVGVYDPALIGASADLRKNPAIHGQTGSKVRPGQRAPSGVTPKRRTRGDG